MAEVKLVNVKKIYPFVSGEEKKSKKKKKGEEPAEEKKVNLQITCLLYTSPSPRDMRRSRMPSSA